MTARLSDDARREVGRLAESGASYSSIQQMFGISKALITKCRKEYLIARGKPLTPRKKPKKKSGPKPKPKPDLTATLAPPLTSIHVPALTQVQILVHAFHWFAMGLLEHAKAFADPDLVRNQPSESILRGQFLSEQFQIISRGDPGGSSVPRA